MGVLQQTHYKHDNIDKVNRHTNNAKIIQNKIHDIAQVNTKCLCEIEILLYSQGKAKWTHNGTTTHYNREILSPWSWSTPKCKSKRDIKENTCKYVSDQIRSKQKWILLCFFLKKFFILFYFPNYRLRLHHLKQN